MDDNPLSLYIAEVEIFAGSLEEAQRVLAERLGHDEWYGFDYQIPDWSVRPV